MHAGEEPPGGPAPPVRRWVENDQSDAVDNVDVGRVALVEDPAPVRADQVEGPDCRDLPRRAMPSRRSRGGLTTKIHLASERRCRPPAFVVTPGQAGEAPAFPLVMARIRVSRPVGRPRTTPAAVLVDKAYPRRRETSAIEWPWAHSKTIRDRRAKAWAVVRRRTQPSSTARRASVTDNGGSSGPGRVTPTNDESLTQVTSAGAGRLCRGGR